MVVVVVLGGSDDLLRCSLATRGCVRSQRGDEPHLAAFFNRKDAAESMSIFPCPRVTCAAFRRFSVVMQEVLTALPPWTFFLSFLPSTRPEQ